MPRGAKPGERRGGRLKGSKNKIAVQHDLLAEQRRARRLGEVPAVRFGKDVLHDFMKFAAAQAVKHQPKTADGPWDEAEEAKFKEWAKLACAWAKDLTPYQSPTYASIEMSVRTETEDDGVMKVIHTVEEMRIELLRQGVPPDDLGRALLASSAIEHDPKEKPKVKKTRSSTAKPAARSSSAAGVVKFCEICLGNTLHVDGVCALSNLHKAGA